MPETSAPQSGPARAGIVLTALILAALVANLNLSVANIALPDIGRAFDATQTQVNLIALGCTLGLAMSVLYLGALGDRYGRKLLLLLGLGLTVPLSFLCAYAPSANLLVAGRILIGVAAGLAYPTTLALITALWSSGPKRVAAIALWSGVSGGGAIIGPVIAGALLEGFWWGSVFLIAVPPAVVAFVLVIWRVPSHVNESSNPVDHLSGVLSVVMIALLVLGLGTISAPGALARAVVLIVAALLLAVIFALRQSRARIPLYPLAYARRQLFWVPAIAGMIVFGSLMGAMFIGQQYLQDVLGYSTLDAGFAVLPAAIGMMAIAPLSARLVVSRGSKFTLLAGYACILPAFIIMLIGWRQGSSYFIVGIAYLLVGVGAGLALTPASRSLTSSVPVSQVGMASATNDLQRDLGGSVMQAILGSLLTAGYATAFSAAIADSPEASTVSDRTEAILTQSFASAANLAQQNPTYAQAIIDAARASFNAGANWAFAAGSAAVILGALLVAAAFPGKARERDLLQAYQQADLQLPGSQAGAAMAEGGQGR
ncbi:MAG: MFS transporter [Actinomycetales bacterium]|nr:MFS transporter [Actinomycetales bacterium]